MHSPWDMINALDSSIIERSQRLLLTSCSIEYSARFLMPRVFILRLCTGEEDFDECLNLACAASEHMAWQISKLVSIVYLQPPYLLWIC